MTQIINTTGAYRERITVNKIDALPGQYHVKLETQYADSRNPDAWRTVYQTTCEQWGLEALGREVYEAVVQSK
jgi:hypothetical protein